MSALPDNDKDLQAYEGGSGGYMTFQEGDNKVRVLSDFIGGLEYYKDAAGDIIPKGERLPKGCKPVRSKDDEGWSPEEKDACRPFWAGVVWNYDSEEVQIIRITQQGIRNPIRELLADEDWGDFRGVNGYDLVINKLKYNDKTSYSVRAKPKKKFAKDLLEEAKKTKINLKELYTGGNPFGNATESEEQEEKEDEPVKPKKKSKEETVNPEDLPF